MRPRNLDEFVGQAHLVGEGRALRKAIQNKHLYSMLFYGPPGSGKTALAQVMAREMESPFVSLTAVSAGVHDLRKTAGEAKRHLAMFGQPVILIVDEIHRFNRGQQDVLLPLVEEGEVILIGLTTENPYFEVNAPLLSRLQVCRFYPLAPEELRVIVDRALQDPVRGVGKYDIELKADALEHWITMSQGDARFVLNALERAVRARASEKKIVIDLDLAEDVVQVRSLKYDQTGDEHYDVVSAFIKSIRGSDPDAALHYLARMLKAGEDPRFIARRLIILASEDVGLADPLALVMASSCAQGVEHVGLPEAELVLAETVIYLATAPKSNSSYLAWKRALGDVERGNIGSVPAHLRDASYRGASRLGHGKGYKYPHDYPGHWVEQQYLPDELRNARYYEPGDLGYEASLSKRTERLPANAGLAAPKSGAGDADKGGRGTGRKVAD